MKRHIIAWLLILSLTLSLLPAVGAAGQPGDETWPDDPNYGFTYRFVTHDTVEITSYDGYETEVSVPSSIDGFTVVGIAGFHCTAGYMDTNTKVKKVILPDTVTYIGEDAFAQKYDGWTTEFSALEEVVLPTNLKSIGTRAFANLFMLKKVDIPASVTSIGEDAFKNCTALKDITLRCDSLAMEASAFGSKNGYLSPFAGILQEKYDEWLWAEEASDFFVWNGWLYAYKGDSKTPVLPSGIVGIGVSAFEGMDLTGVTLPAGLKVIGMNAFANNAGLTSVDIPAGVERLDYGAFSDCTSLSSVTLRQGLKRIGENVFDDCTALKSITIPDGVEVVDEGAFSGCENLAKISFPASVAETYTSTIQDTQYYSDLPNGEQMYCGGVYLGMKRDDYRDYPSSLTIRSGTKTVNIEYQPDGLNELILPDGLKTFILKYGGDYCGITSLTFPESVDYIDCSCLTCLTTVKLPQEAELAQGAFDSCWKLKSVTIPKGNTCLNAFADCHAIETLTIPDDVVELDAVGGAGLKSIHLGKIRVLGKDALKDETRLESVTLPDTLIAVESGALSGCSGLQAVKGGKNVRTLGDSCFKDCPALTDFGDLPDSVRLIGMCALENTGWYHDQPDGPVYFGSVAYAYKGTIPANTVLALKAGTTAVSDGYIFEHESRYWEKEDVKNVIAVVLPDSVRRVGSNAFANCENLKSIDLGGVQYIGREAFNSSACEAIALPDTVRYVGSNAFSGTALKAIHLNNGLRVLEEGAFFSGGAGKGVTIPASVTYLGAQCLGYYPPEPDNPFGGTETIPNFVIYGVSGTAAETYANKSGITFRTDGGCTSHKYVTETVSATCQAGGFTRKTCTLCGYAEVSGATAAGSHKAAANTAIEATCTRPGFTGGSHCVSCGEVLSAPTQTPALGHSWRSDTMGANNPIQYFGMIWHYCSRCGMTWYEPSSIAHVHDYSYNVSEVYPSCTLQGYTEYTCACGASIKGNYTDPLGHYFEWVTDVVATETEAGCKHEECTRCHLVTRNENTVIPPTGSGHEHSYQPTVKAPTCYEPGYTTYTCACGESYMDDNSYIEALGHNFVEGVCTRCGATESSVQPHEHSYQTSIVAPTCTEKGYTLHVCACGDSYRDSYVDALGHNFVNGICTRCGIKEGACDGGEGCPSRKFVDVNPKEWYHPYVDYAVTHGLFGGTSDHTFEPEAAMTRAMLVTVLWRYEGQPKGYQNTFTDVNAKNGGWYIDAVAWAAANGVVNGVGNGRFDPEGKITREQMATILFRYAQEKGIDTSKRGSLGGFSDAERVSVYAKDALQWAVGEGIINGSDGKLLPQGSATRAQVATILMRYIENIVKK